MSQAKSAATKKVLGVFALVMINVSLIVSLRGLPLMAEYGLSIVFFLLVATILFLIPVSLVSAELATGWQKGGVYAWVREAWGEKAGFLAAWLQWAQNLVFYPTALAATAAVVAYMIDPALASNKLFNFLIIVTVYWGATLINFRGMKLSGMISSIGVMTGIILPGVLLIVLAIIWLASGNPSEITFSLKNFWPDLSQIQNIAFFSGVLLFFAGMEVSAIHAQEVKNPKKDYPKAIAISAVVIIGMFLLGSLAIAIIVPQQEISLTAGLMQTFAIVFGKFNILWVIPIIVILAAPGMMAQVSTWIAGPSRALLATAENGDLPKFFQHRNKNGMPTHILIVQGGIVTVISIVFLLMPSVSSSFWILTALAAQLYLTMYILLFSAGIKLRYSKPNVERAYRVPWGKFGIWFFSGLGVFAGIAAILLGFLPPSQLPTGNLLFYEAFLILGMGLMILVPLTLYHFKKPSWKEGAKKT